MPRLMLQLPLSDCVPVEVSAAVPVALGAKVALALFLIEEMLTLLMLLKDCRAKQTNKHALDCNCN